MQRKILKKKYEIIFGNIFNTLFLSAFWETGIRNKHQCFHYLKNSAYVFF